MSILIVHLLLNPLTEKFVESHTEFKDALIEKALPLDIGCGNCRLIVVE